MKIETSAPGKLILLGEYAVLEGAPALVVAVNRFAEVTLQSIPSRHSLLEAPAIGITDLPFTVDAKGKANFGKFISKMERHSLSFFTAAVETVLSPGQNSDPLPCFSIYLNTSQFFTPENEKLGLGSSAALTVALCAALYKFRNPHFEAEKESNFIFATSLEIHRRAQQNIGSGIDIAASVFGGALKYQLADSDLKTLPIREKLTIPEDLHILSIWSGESASTAYLVRKVKQFKMERPDEYEGIMERMKQASLAGIAAIQQKDAREFMKASQLYYHEMKSIGEKGGIPIVSPTHRRINDLVTAEGGAYKPSGAGGGDIGIAFCNSAMVKEKIRRSLSRNGFQTIDLKFAEKGVDLKTL